jgi:hypothetical protein
MGFELRREPKVEAADDFAKRMKKVHEETASALERAANEMKKYADRNKTDAPEYKEGDLVWLEASDIKQNRPSKKLSDKRLGPYKIVRQLNRNAYALELPANFRIHNSFHVSKLHRYNRPTIPNQKPTPPLPVEVEGEEEYEIEKILDSRMRGGKLEYLIRWEGYTKDEDTWEPAGNAKHSPDAIADFHRQHPGAPRKLTVTTLGALYFRPRETFTDAELTRKEYERTKHIPTGRIGRRPYAPNYSESREDKAYQEAETDDFDDEEVHEDPDKTPRQGCRGLEGG